MFFCGPSLQDHPPPPSPKPNHSGFVSREQERERERDPSIQKIGGGSGGFLLLILLDQATAQPVTLLLGRDLGHRDRDGFSSRKQSLTVIAVGQSLFLNEGGVGSIVGNQGGETREGTTVGALDDHIGDRRVQLSVTFVVVPEQVEDGGARGGRGGDGEGQNEVVAVGCVHHAVEQEILEDHPGHGVVIGEGPLAAVMMRDWRAGSEW